MSLRRPLLSSVLASGLLLSMAPMPAPIYMNVPVDETLETRVTLSQAVLCDGSVRLEAGMYDLKLRSLGDGSVRATFTGKGKIGQATGKVQGHDGIPAEGQKVQPAPGTANAMIIHWSTLGFTPESVASLQRVGNQANLLVKGRGNNQILIGLLLPAVQKGREAAAVPLR